jgi:hypothetical protein
MLTIGKAGSLVFPQLVQDIEALRAATTFRSANTTQNFQLRKLVEGERGRCT